MRLCTLLDDFFLQKVGLKKYAFFLAGGIISTFLLTDCSSTSAVSRPNAPVTELPKTASNGTSSVDPFPSRRSVVAPLSLSETEALEIGKRIWQNECNGTVDGLTSWNKGEEFASLGIGHFIWFPKEYRGPFGEAFPRLVDYLIANDAPVPRWLKENFRKGNRACPWTSREEFNADLQSQQMRELRQMLSETVSLQARLIARRMELSLAKIVDAVPEESAKERITTQFYRVAASPMGLYALTDYVNFKGEGISTSEIYNHVGWGLRHVLEDMQETESGRAALEEFSQAAERRLTERVRNSPPERNESAWLSNWTQRVRSYLK
jgi:hypothetical protein